MASDWFERAFRTEYLEVYRHRDLAAARAEMRHLVARGIAGRVLDLGCGFGRHSLALLEAGVDAYGLDLSHDLLTRAAERLGSEGGDRLRGRLVRGDFRALPFAAACFDGAVMLFSSFGYLDDAGNARVLDEAARVIRDGGTLVLDLMNAERVRSSLVPESTAERAGRTIHERRRLTEGGRRVRKDVVTRGPDGEERRWHEDVRLYEPDEVRALLAEHGFSMERVDGDFDGRRADGDAPRNVVWARRGA